MAHLYLESLRASIVIADTSSARVVPIGFAISKSDIDVALKQHNFIGCIAAAYRLIISHKSLLLFLLVMEMI
jgi:hypothetical protein